MSQRHLSINLDLSNPIGLPHSTDHCHILIMLSARLDINKYKFLSHWFDSTRVGTHEVRIPQPTKMGDGRSTHLVIPSHLVGGGNPL